MKGRAFHSSLWPPSYRYRPTSSVTVPSPRPRVLGAVLTAFLTHFLLSSTLWRSESPPHSAAVTAVSSPPPTSSPPRSPRTCDAPLSKPLALQALSPLSFSPHPPLLTLTLPSVSSPWLLSPLLDLRCFRASSHFLSPRCPCCRCPLTTVSTISFLLVSLPPSPYLQGAPRDGTPSSPSHR